MTLGLIAVGPAFSQWFYGPGYEKVQTLMPICAPIIFIITMSNCLGIQCLLPCGKRVQNAVALWIGAGINLVANLILIPHFASIGAAIGTIIAETAITIMFIVFSRKYLSFGKILKGFKNYLIAGAIMFVGLLVLRHYMPAPTVANTLIQTGTGVVVYGIVLLLTRDEFLFENLRLLGNKMKLVRKKG
jgi:O-antigen/teichoic acid export membrane protein